MKKIFSFVICFLIWQSTMGQDFIFNKETGIMVVPFVNIGIQWTVGSSCLQIIVQDTDNSNDTIFKSIGCSQYSLESDEWRTMLRIYCWPFDFYSEDCALEDGIRPNKSDNVLTFQYTFENKNIREKNIYADVRWNNTQYNFDSVAYAFALNHDTVSAYNFFVHQDYDIYRAPPVHNDTFPHIEEPYEKYEKDVIGTLLPLHNKSFSMSEIHILKDCLEKINKKYNLR